ncbi:MAG: zinc-dependent alcohol dehydrogenase [Promethearchaeota archaeon]
MKGILFVKAKEVQYKEDLPDPEIKPDEVLIKVKICGICGSDIESYETGKLEIPGIILGHEFSGEIAKLGENVKSFEIGDRVGANPILSCDNCYWCKQGQEHMCKWSSGIGTTYNGAMAEYLVIKADNIYKLPDSVTFEMAAMLDPIAVGVYALQESSFKEGDNAVVIGAGTIGLFMIQVLKASRASKIFVLEPVKSKQEKAKAVGATQVFTPNQWSKIIRATKKIGPDFIFDCAGNPQTFMTSLQLIKKGGFISVIGIHVEKFEMKGFLQLMLKNITMRGMYAYDGGTFKTALTLLEKGKINMDPIITNRITLKEVPAMFEKLSNPPHEEIKVIIKMD